MSELAILIIKRFVPYGVALVAGWGMAWHIQGLRLTAAEQAHEQYILDAQRAQQEARDYADKQRAESEKRYDDAKKQLMAAIKNGDVYKRCVASGRCDGLRVGESLRQTGAIPTGIRFDATGSNSVFAAGTATAGVVSECAITTLQLNQLQAAIEAQEGY